MRWRGNRRKVRRFVAQDNGILIMTARAVHGSKAKRVIHSLLQISRQTSSCFLGSMASAHMAVDWEDKHHDHEHSSFPSVPWASTAEHNMMWSVVSLWSVQLGCPSCVPSQSHALFQPIHWSGMVQGRVGTRRGLAAVQTLLCNNKKYQWVISSFPAKD